MREELQFSRKQKRKRLLAATACLCLSSAPFPAYAQFAFAVGGTGWEFADAVDIDADGNVAVIGRFEGDVDFDPGPGTAMLNATSFGERFIARYDAFGTLLYAFALGTPAAGFASIAHDSGGNVFVTGSVSNEVDFDPGPDTLTLSSDGGTAYVASYDTAGDLRFAFNFGSGTALFEREVPEQVVVDAAGDVYVVGTFAGTVDFDPGAGEFLLTSAGGVDAFVASYSNDGTFRLAFAVGGQDDDFGTALAVDDGGGMYLGGEFRDTADFNPSAGVFELTAAGPSSAGADAFVASYDSAGNLRYASGFGGPEFSPDDDSVLALAVDSNGNVFATGEMEGIGDFDPGPGTLMLESNGGRDAYLVSLDPFGALRFGFNFGGPENDNSFELAVTPADEVLIGGKVLGVVDFDPGPGEFLLSATNTDGYLAQYDNLGGLVAATLLNTAADAQCSEITGLSLNDSGTLAAIGEFRGEIDADFGSGTQTLTSTSLSFFTEDIFVSTYSLVEPVADTDGDGVPDAVDNCTEVSNPDQRDTDVDGYGNACDADLNQDLQINFADLGLLKAVFFSADADADFDGDGSVNFTDLGIMKQMFFSAPGPSGLVP